jgi:plasmid maintenance system antidote protein VapI
MKMPWGYVKRLVEGKDTLTDQAAEMLGKIIGPNKDFWIRREMQYKEKV